MDKVPSGILSHISKLSDLEDLLDIEGLLSPVGLVGEIVSALVLPVEAEEPPLSDELGEVEGEVSVGGGIEGSSIL